MKKTLTNERGSALLICLAVMGMLTIVAISAADFATTDAELSFNQMHTDQSFYIAEAGLAHAYESISADTSWRAGYNGFAFGGGAYSVKIKDSLTDPVLGDTVLLISTGNINGANSILEATIVPEPFLPYQFGLFAYDSLHIENSVSTDSWNSDSGTFVSTYELTYGSVGSNGTILVENNPIIAGDVMTAEEDGIVITGSGQVLGDTSTTAPEQDFSRLMTDQDFLDAKTNNSAPLGFSGSYDYNWATGNLTVNSGQVMTLQSGVYYLNNIKLLQDAEIVLAPGAQVEIYMTGDFDLRNKAIVNPDGRPIDFKVFSKGDKFTLGQSAEFSGVVVAPKVHFDLNNYADYSGSMIAGSILIGNNPRFHYDRSLRNVKRGYTGRMIRAAWRELDGV
jgi:hypothetical protein